MKNKLMKIVVAFTMLFRLSAAFASTASATEVYNNGGRVVKIDRQKVVSGSTLLSSKVGTDEYRMKQEVMRRYHRVDRNRKYTFFCKKVYDRRSVKVADVINLIR